MELNIYDSKKTTRYLDTTMVFRGGSRISLWGSTNPRWRGDNLQHGHFLAKTYVKMKEFGPVGGGRRKLLCVDPPLARIERKKESKEERKR